MFVFVKTMVAFREEQGCLAWGSNMANMLLSFLIGLDLYSSRLLSTALAAAVFAEFVRTVRLKGLEGNRAK